MKNGFVKVAAMTMKVKVADPKHNADMVCQKLLEAYEKDAKVIVFPELCLTGYTCGDLFLQGMLLEEALVQLHRVADATEGHAALVFVGLPVEKDGRLYNVAAALCDGAIIGMVPKSFIPGYGESSENRYFLEGNREVEDFNLDGENIPFGTNILFNCNTVKGLVVGCEICEDLWVAAPPSTNHALAGATVIVNLSASSESVGKDDYRQMLLEATSGRLLCGYVYSSAGDGESTQDLVHSGHNMIAENGKLLAEAKRFACESIYSDIDVQRLMFERRRMGIWGREPKEKYLTIPFDLEKKETKLDRTFDPRPFIPSEKESWKKRCEEILELQANGLKKRYEHIGCKTAVIGLSGGLDSTLALLVTVKTFDMLGIERNNIKTITMPCFGTTNRTYTNACTLARTLGTELREIDIKESVLVHFDAIGHDKNVQDVTYENAQARERTQILMDIANKIGGLVIGTGDMSELALGWATYNGDHMSMYGVNAGVPKTLVRHLVQYYAETCSDEELAAVLLDVLDTPVSPELLPPEDGKISQKTEDLVGPYELHDFFLYYMLRLAFPPEKIYRIAKVAFAGIYEEEIILKWLKTFYRRFFQQQFKRSCLPDGPKVGSVSVSPRGDLRMPSDASAALWMKQIEDLQ